MRWWMWIVAIVLIIAILSIWQVFRTVGSILDVTDLEAAAVAYMEQGDYDEAESLLMQALEIAKSDMSEGNIAPVQINLARALAGQRRFDEAESHAKQALEIFKRTHGPTNTLVAYSLKLLSEISEAKGKYSEAEVYLHEAADILNRVESHPELGNPEMREALRKAVQSDNSGDEL